MERVHAYDFFLLSELMDRIRGVGNMREEMLADEAAIGATEVSYSEPWFTPLEFKSLTIITRKGDDIRIVAIAATTPRTGSFTRLVRAIRRAGLNPVVCTPLDHMENILRQWRWIRTITGHGILQREEWRPCACWKPD